MANELIVQCPDEQATMQVAEKLATQLNGGDCIELVGDLGSGKTTFVKGLARGLGSEDKVSSPSFALQNIYQGHLRLHHFDLYRLQEPGLIINEIQEALSQDDSIIVIEWAQSALDALPQQRIIINFSLAGQQARTLKISLPERVK